MPRETRRPEPTSLNALTDTPHIQEIIEHLLSSTGNINSALGEVREMVQECQSPRALGQ